MAVASEVHFCCFYFCFLSSSLANHAFHTKEILWSIQHHRTHQRWRCTFILMALLWTFRLQVSLSRWTFYNQQKIMQTRQSTIRPFWAFSPYFFHLFFSSMCSSETVAVFGGYYDCVVQWYGLVRPPPQQRLRAKDWATSWSQLWHMLFFYTTKDTTFSKASSSGFSWGLQLPLCDPFGVFSLKIQAIFFS